VEDSATNYLFVSTLETEWIVSETELLALLTHKAVPKNNLARDLPKANPLPGLFWSYREFPL